MDTFIGITSLYMGTCTEILQKLLLTTVNYVVEAVGATSNTIYQLTNCISKPSDQIGLSFIEFYKQSIGLPSFDQFQMLLVKIFLLTLLTIIIMIYAAWHVYGSAIADRFMYSDVIMENEQNDTDSC